MSKDIEQLMDLNDELAAKDKEIERLTELCNKYEEEHKTTFETWQKDIKENEKLHSIIKEVREYIKKYRTMVDGYEDEDTGQMVYEHRLKLNKHQVRKLLEILDKVEEKI